MTPPREVYRFDGAESAEDAFLAALDRGRLHHAWLLTGPQGVGKATFAYRAARRLLGATADPAYGLLGASPDDPVSRQVAAQSHPDLLVLEREEGKRNIPVDEARRLPEFFSKAPATAPYRVAIVDAADDLNVNAANAILKSLEEPPARGVLLLVCHAPGRLLPTIRSRCRRLSFHSRDEAAVTAFVERETDVGPEAAAKLARMARGSPGRALSLAAMDAPAADAEAAEILRRLPVTDDAALQALADRFRGAEGQKRFDLICDRLADHIHAMALRSVEAGETDSLDAWAALWRRLQDLPGETEGLNLDRADAFWTLVADLKAVARV